MIWVALAPLGIPIWLIVVALVTVFKNRKSVKSDPYAFELKTATDKGWSRTSGSGKWVSDVLIMRTGLALVPVDASQVSNVVIQGILDPTHKGLGKSATELAITHADGAGISIAVSTGDLDIAKGPTIG